MTQEDKKLIYQDLCGRLPYHPILNWKFIDNTSKDEELKELSDLYIWWITKAQDCEVKPYLRPMSSMTEEEYEEYRNIDNRSYSCPMDYAHIPASDRIDWLNKHHFDYRGLIEKGLAIKVTKENNPYC